MFPSADGGMSLCSIRGAQTGDTLWPSVSSCRRGHGNSRRPTACIWGTSTRKRQLRIHTRDCEWLHCLLQGGAATLFVGTLLRRHVELRCSGDGRCRWQLKGRTIARAAREAPPEALADPVENDSGAMGGAPLEGSVEGTADASDLGDGIPMLDLNDLDEETRAALEAQAADGEIPMLDFDDDASMEDIMKAIGGEGAARSDSGDLLGNGQLVKSVIQPAPPGTRRPQLGDEVKVHFIGTLMDGKVFDDSRAKREPYKFRLGLGHVIDGWDKGVATMCKGERSLFTIAPELAYGDQGAGWKIPANAAVRFDIELLDFEELDNMGDEDEDFEEEPLDEVSHRQKLQAEMYPGLLDVGAGGEDLAGRYRWERRGQEVLVIAPLAPDVGARDVDAEFLPNRLRVAFRSGEERDGEVLLEGTPGCELEWEECCFEVDEDAAGRRCLFVRLQKRHPEKDVWPPSLLLEHDELDTDAAPTNVDASRAERPPPVRWTRSGDQDSGSSKTDAAVGGVEGAATSPSARPPPVRWSRKRAEDIGT